MMSAGQNNLDSDLETVEKSENLFDSALKDLAAEVDGIFHYEEIIEHEGDMYAVEREYQSSFESRSSLGDAATLLDEDEEDIKKAEISDFYVFDEKEGEFQEYKGDVTPLLQEVHSY